MNYYEKYLKYKTKYTELKKLMGGELHNPQVLQYNKPEIIKQHLQEYDLNDLEEEYNRYKWLRDEAKGQNNKPKCLEEDAKIIALMEDGRLKQLLQYEQEYEKYVNNVASWQSSAAYDYSSSHGFVEPTVPSFITDSDFLQRIQKRIWRKVSLEYNSNK